MSPPVEWERWPGEPAQWYARFLRFAQLGPGRTLIAAYNAEREERGESPTESTSGAYRQAARDWSWVERAAAYDRDRLLEQQKAAAAQMPAIYERLAVKVFEALETVTLKPDDVISAVQLLRDVFPGETLAQLHSLLDERAAAARDRRAAGGPLGALPGAPDDGPRE